MFERRASKARARLAAFEAAEAAARAARDEAAGRKAEAKAALSGLTPSDALVVEMGQGYSAVAAMRATEAKARAMLQAWSRDREARVRRTAAIANEVRSW